VGDARFSTACLLLHSGHAGVGCRVSVTASSIYTWSVLLAWTYHLHFCYLSGFGLDSPGKRAPSSILLPRGNPACSGLWCCVARAWNVHILYMIYCDGVLFFNLFLYFGTCMAFSFGRPERL
jgi:hypothetical protein